MSIPALEVTRFVIWAHAAKRAFGLAKGGLGDLAVALAIERGQRQSKSVATVEVSDRGVFYSLDHRDIHEVRLIPKTNCHRNLVAQA